jgi:ABC-type Fe3+-siderophore transport system permease subunit
MTMFRSYVTVLAFSLGLSNFAVLAWASGNGHAASWRNFVISAVAVFLLVSLIFILLKLLRLHDSRIAARALTQRSAQIADFKNSLRNQTLSGPEFSRGFNPWNS